MNIDLLSHLKQSDQRVAALGRITPELLENVPLEIFARILLGELDSYVPSMRRFLPRMPPDQVQIDWTGSADSTLMRQSVSFIRILTATFSNLSSKSLHESRVMDFGCGWGRLTRMMYKYVRQENLIGLDPWQKSIDICKSCGITSPLFVSDYLPRKLPVGANVKFDFIFAFSVFTHLSLKAATISLNTLSSHLSDDGIIAITIRPLDYWNHHFAVQKDLSKEQIKSLVSQHQQSGFAFTPHNREPVEGEVTYGDTSMTLEFLSRSFPELCVIAVEWSEIDPFQTIVFLRRR